MQFSETSNHFKSESQKTTVKYMSNTGPEDDLTSQLEEYVLFMINGWGNKQNDWDKDLAQNKFGGRDLSDLNFSKNRVLI